MTNVYKVSNINGKFNHIVGKIAAVNYARAIEQDDTLTEKELVNQYGWDFKKVSASVAKSVGL